MVCSCGSLWPLLSIPEETLSQESKMWTFWCLSETLGCSFFGFAGFCEREVEPSWVQTFWTFSDPPHPLAPPSPLPPYTLRRWIVIVLYFFVRGPWTWPHSPFFHLSLLQQNFFRGPWTWPWCTPFFTLPFVATCAVVLHIVPFTPIYRWNEVLNSAIE